MNNPVKLGVVALALAGALGLAACKEEEQAAAPAACTEEQAVEKLQTMMTRMQEVATTAPERLADIAPRAQELQEQLTANPEDTAAACAALDELIEAMG